jgi:nitrate/nitrite transporter NarK
MACVLWTMLKEPQRGLSDGAAGKLPASSPIIEGLRELARNRAAWALVTVFIGANFVAMVFTVWMPTYLVLTFHMSLSMAGFSAAAYLQIASVVGVISGGALADVRVRRTPADRSARMSVQALGLFCGVPFLLLSGLATTVTAILAAMIGFGLFKGIYDSNLWAALYDVVPIERRGAALGIMNSLGWLGGAAAQLSIGLASQHFGMSACLSATAIIYLSVAILLRSGARRLRSPVTPGSL